MKRLAMLVFMAVAGLVVVATGVFTSARAQGVIPTVIITPTSMSFPNTRVGSTATTQTFTITKDNSYLPLAIFSVKLADTSDFQIVSDGCTGHVLDQGESCEVAISFTPLDRGHFTTSMSIISLSYGVVDSAKISGQGVSPAVTLSQTSLDFGHQTVGHAGVPRTVTVQNSGTDTLTFGTIQISGEFTLGGTCVLTLEPNATCDLIIDFVPTTVGAKTGEVVLIDDAPTTPQTITLAGTGIPEGSPDVGLSATSLQFPATLIGVQSSAILVNLTNTGTADLTINSIEAAGDFAQENTCANTIVPSGTCAISVTFTPTAVGARTGTITLTDNATDSPQVITLTGVGADIGTPQMSLSTATLDFGNVLVGSTSTTQTVTVVNSGGADMGSITATIEGEDISIHGFTAVNHCGGILLLPGSSCLIDVSFAPQQVGSLAATLSVASNASNSPQSVSLTGTGTQSSGGGCSLIVPKQ